MGKEKVLGVREGWQEIHSNDKDGMTCLFRSRRQLHGWGRHEESWFMGKVVDNLIG